MDFLIVIFPLGKTVETLSPAHRHEAAATPGLSKKSKYLKSGVRDVKSQKIWRMLTGLLESTKPFLDPNLDLKQLSAMLDVKAHVLSEVINVHGKCNFYRLLDLYRHKHAKHLLKQDVLCKRKLLDIALSSGYASQTHFFSCFKRNAGITPRLYRLEVTKNSDAGIEIQK